MFWLIPKNIPINWSDEATNANVQSLFISLWLSFLAFFVFRQWYIVIPLSILIFTIAYRLNSRRRHQVSRVFFVEYSDATVIVGRVLSDKGLPFDRKRNVYRLEDISIELRTYWIRRVGSFGTQVYLGPVNPATRPMIERLKVKLDEEFLGYDV